MSAQGSWSFLFCSLPFHSPVTISIISSHSLSYSLFLLQSFWNPLIIIIFSVKQFFCTSFMSQLLLQTVEPHLQSLSFRFYVLSLSIPSLNKLQLSTLHPYDSITYISNRIPLIIVRFQNERHH